MSRTPGRFFCRSFVSFVLFVLSLLLLAGCESVTPAENTYRHDVRQTREEIPQPPKPDAQGVPQPQPPVVKTTTETTLEQTSKGAGSATAFTKGTADSKAGAITPVDEKGVDTQGPTKDDKPAVGESGGGITGIVAGLSHGGGAFMFIGGVLMVACAAAAIWFKTPMLWFGALFGAGLFGLGWVMNFAPWVIWLAIGLVIVGGVLVFLNTKAFADLWAHFKTVTAAVDALPAAEQEDVRQEVQARAGGKGSAGDDNLKEFVAVAKKEIRAAAAKVAKLAPNVLPAKPAPSSASSSSPASTASSVRLP